MCTSPASDRCGPAEAAAIRGQKQGAFNNERRHLQMVYNRLTGRLEAYPSKETIHALYQQAGSPGLRPSRIDLAESWFQSTRWLVVPEWGGSQPPGSGWTYSRKKLQRLREEGPGALGPHLAVAPSE